jgi:hypothetical protein
MSKASPTSGALKAGCEACPQSDADMWSPGSQGGQGVPLSAQAPLSWLPLG